MLRFIHRSASSFLFSTKHLKQTGIIKVHRSKINQSLNGQQIYLTQKTKLNLISSIIFGLGLSFSLYVFYHETTVINLFPTLITVCAFLFHQRRIMSTINQIIVQKSGDKIRIKNYGIFGTKLFSKTTIAPIHIMEGVARKKLNKAIVLLGGGKYGIKRFSFYFHQEGVKDKYVFDNVIGGKNVKYVDIL